MAYTPTEWQVGDTITAEKLNKAEKGITDAFVAPEVTAADQGKVLTVDSSGDWAAESLPADIADKKTFIYDLTIDAQTGTMSISLDASSPVPAVADFVHPERNQVKLIALNQLPTAAYIVLYLPLAMELSVTGPDGVISYRYSKVGSLGTTMAEFTVQLWEVSGEIRAELLYTPIE